jgi:FtsH-binding integral membrane protein
MFVIFFTQKMSTLDTPPAYTPYSEQSPLYDKKTGDDFKISDVNERHSFILRVYTILLFMLGLTISTCGLFMTSESVGNWVNKNVTPLTIFCIIFMFSTLLMIMCIPVCRYIMPYNFMCLSLFTLSVSVLVGTVTVQYETNAVLLAFGATAIITISLTLFAFQTKIDFTGAGPYLLAILIGLIFMGIIQIWVKNQLLNTITASIGSILFSFYIIYDTQLMLGGDHKHSIGPDEYIFAALSLYLDVINLFLYLLQLISGKN